MAARVKQTTVDKIADRRRRVAELRLQHHTQAEIAKAVGVSVATVNGDLKAIRDEWADRRTTSYEEWVGEEIAKMDRLERTLLPQAIVGDYAAVDRILAVMDRRARMLGLDKPQQHQHTVITMDAIEAEITRLEAELAADAADAPTA